MDRVKIPDKMPSQSQILTQLRTFLVWKVGTGKKGPKTIKELKLLLEEIYRESIPRHSKMVICFNGESIICSISTNNLLHYTTKICYCL